MDLKLDRGKQEVMFINYSQLNRIRLAANSYLKLRYNHFRKGNLEAFLSAALSSVCLSEKKA